MITYFFTGEGVVYLVQSLEHLDSTANEKLEWLLSARVSPEDRLDGQFVGPRRSLVTPWSTNACEIASNVGIGGIVRIERFRSASTGDSYDSMVEDAYECLNTDSLNTDRTAEPLLAIEDIAAYNRQMGLALSEEEVGFLIKASERLGRTLTDAEVFSFAQINSEHCRHKIFNATFIIDGQTKASSLFSLIKETSAQSPENLVSAYKDNVAFFSHSPMDRFAPESRDKPSVYTSNRIECVLSLKAETHNFPTTVEPFSGASTGSGGEIRDRMAGGTGSIPLAGCAVYMTAYPRELGIGSSKRNALAQRPWKYQTPMEILIKASNGASDFGNKFGQPLIVGSLLTFEQEVLLTKTAKDSTPDLSETKLYGFDRAIMLAGGIGWADSRFAQKKSLAIGDKVVVLGGDNYRIGLAGGSVSSVDTGAYSRELELSAVQRANPEMQKRVFNAVRALAESDENPCKSIHDHGAGGHVNCLSELLEPLGGKIHTDSLPIGDPTLSPRELIANESQERMGLVVDDESLSLLRRICDRESAPMYEVGEITGEESVVFESKNGSRPINLPLDVLFGSSPKLVIEDETTKILGADVDLSIKSKEDFLEALKQVLSLESVACKDWLTNKVDRSVTGKVALQQCAGPLQLPVNNLGVTALDYSGSAGVALSVGHAPIAGLLDERKGSVLSVAESLTNIVWAPLEHGLASVVLSANWMWPCKQAGESARLYNAVEALSEFAVELGIAVPTGKDSLSMTMNYGGSTPQVRAPGTVVVSASAAVKNVRACVTPVLAKDTVTEILYVNLSQEEANNLGASSLAQVRGGLGSLPPGVVSAKTFAKGFNLLQELISSGDVLAGHDVSSGGVIGALLEMAFASDCGLTIEPRADIEAGSSFLFCEKPAVLIQVDSSSAEAIRKKFIYIGIPAISIARPQESTGTVLDQKTIEVSFAGNHIETSMTELRRVWFGTSFVFDKEQSLNGKANERYESFDKLPHEYKFPSSLTGIWARNPSSSDPLAIVLREKGSNGEREMAYALHASGFRVKDVTMRDITSGNEDLRGCRFLVFPGGFSNSDVLGAARGWAGVFRYNELAKAALANFFSRDDTLSLGVCNGCQLVCELGLLSTDMASHPSMSVNESQKFESAFLEVEIPDSPSIMLKDLIGSRLGIWIAHGEGRFVFPSASSSVSTALCYRSSLYPANPNGSERNAAGVVSSDGRHLAMMPHLERSIMPWQWPHYIDRHSRRDHKFTPWIKAFVSARDWIVGR